MTARERLVNTLRSHMNDGWQHEAERLADKLLADGVTPPPAPAEPPVWPGLEGEGLHRLSDKWTTSYDEACERGLSHNDARRAAYTAEAAFLWRAMVASIPTYTSASEGGDRVWVGYDAVYRAALAALADPYDGGGK